MRLIQRVVGGLSMLLVVTLVTFAKPAPLAHATEIGPGISIDAPASVTVGAGFDVTFSTVGPVPNPYDGIWISAVYNSSLVSVSGVSYNANGTLFASTFCLQDSMSTNFGGLLAPPWLAFDAGCVSLSGATTLTGPALTAHVQASGVGAAVFHLVTAGPPDLPLNLAASYGTYTFVPTTGDVQSNSYSCSGASCGPQPPYNAAWDAMVNIGSLPTDLSIGVTNASPEVGAGDALAVTLSVPNPAGLATATNVVVADVLPALFNGPATTFSGPGAASCGVSLQTVTCAPGDLVAGTTFEVTLHAVASPAITTTTSVTNCATVTLDEIDPTPADNSACSNVQIIPKGPAIVVSGPATAHYGDDITLTFATTGAVANAYRGYQVALTFDPNEATVNGVTDVSAAPGGIWPRDYCPTSNITPGMLVVGCVELAGSTTLTGELMTASVHINKTGPISFHMQSLAEGGATSGTVTVNAFDNLPQMNTLTCSGSCDGSNALVLVAAPDLAVTNTPRSATVSPGDPASFDLSVTNSTLVQATGVVLTTVLPLGTEGNGTTFSGTGAAACFVGGQNVTCNIGTIGASGSFDVTVKTAMTQDANGPVSVCASLTLNEIDPTPADNSACGAVQVSPDSDGDGYSDAREIAIGKNPNVYCAIMRADVNYDGVGNILDLATVAAYYRVSVPPAPARFDQGVLPTDGVINILDLARMAQWYMHDVSGCE